MQLSSLANIIRAARLAVNNTAKDAEVAKKLGQFGFPPRRMQEGVDLLTVVQEIQQVQKAHYDERWQISDQIKQELQAIRPLFTDHVAAARFTFRHQSAVLRTFNIQRLSNNTWTWVEQARAFYEMIGSYTEAMAAHGTPPEALMQAKASVEAVVALRDDLLYKKGEAEDTTESRNEASKRLRRWVSEFRAAARLALKDNPQKLEAFGIRVRSLQK